MRQNVTRLITEWLNDDFGHRSTERVIIKHMLLVEWTPTPTAWILAAIWNIMSEKNDCYTIIWQQQTLLHLVMSMYSVSASILGRHSSWASNVVAMFAGTWAALHYCYWLHRNPNDLWRVITRCSKPPLRRQVQKFWITHPSRVTQKCSLLGWT